MVILIVERLMDEDRLKQGWGIPNLGKTRIILINDTDNVNKLLNSNKRLTFATTKYTLRFVIA